jgi:hypothetical protein
MFSYFIPFTSLHGRQIAEPADFVALGLGYALLEGAGLECRPLDAGPIDSAPGVLCTVGPAPASQPGAQTWRCGPGKRFAVGMGQRCGPGGLVRRNLIPGQDVRLLDGNLWTIPRCTGLVPKRPSTLPYLIDLAEDGVTPIAADHPQYASLCERAFDFWLMFRHAAGAPQLTPVQLVELAIDALSVNYRIGKIEALSLLKLMGEQERNAILRAIIDADEVERYYTEQARVTRDDQKKDTSAASASPMNSGAAV